MSTEAINPSLTEGELNSLRPGTQSEIDTSNFGLAAKQCGDSCLVHKQQLNSTEPLNFELRSNREAKQIDCRTISAFDLAALKMYRCCSFCLPQSLSFCPMCLWVIAERWEIIRRHFVSATLTINN